MLKFNLEIFNNIKNFAHIHSKRRKLGTFILFQKCQFVYTNKINSPPIRQFFPLSIFGHAMCHVPVIKRLGTRKPQDLPLGKNSCCSRSPSERYCQSFICSEHTFDPGVKPLETQTAGQTFQRRGHAWALELPEVSEMRIFKLLESFRSEFTANL